jgi:hypothetical protein
MTSRKIAIANSTVSPVSGGVSKNAKRKMESIFDQSLAILNSGQPPTAASSKARTASLSSYSNSLPIHIDNFSLQRRALVDAAKALATLWKVPENKGSSLQSRRLQFSKEAS